MRRLYSLCPKAGRALFGFALAVALVGGGCGGKEYSDGDLRTVQSVQEGTVLDVTNVIVEEDPSIVGPLVGGAAGGLLGSAFGGGSGRTLFILGGAALGADIGGEQDSGVNYKKRRYSAMQITMELDSGHVLVVVQGHDDLFIKGDRVRVLRMDKGRARVQHL